ncbi:hypothetical protein [Spirillospora sp. CA-294931]|uniref:hypothetical protein n=1 Tax=Spirillospora sp. CA-294931 TaxID=3240042 RepID=UPI003D90BC7D
MSRRRTITAAAALVLAIAGPVATTSTASADSEKDRAGAARCILPDRGWVIFYRDSHCEEPIQGMHQCGPQRFRGPLYNAVSSYNDAQYGGAYAHVYDSAGRYAFGTHPGTGHRQVATWENDRSATATIFCP